MKQISINQCIYEFDVTKKLGSGAFASVHLGIDKNSQEKVAIKVIAKDSLKKYGDDILEAIGSEVNILQSISLACSQDPCPFIARIINCMETQNNIYIVLEYCDQGTMENILKKKKQLPEQEALLLIYQVALSLEYLAKRDIAHRDLKPENVFLKDGICKLGDFGFASQKQMFQTTLGTYPYMAPEFFNSKSYNLSVDVWALGVMLHQVLFNELYFIAKTQYEVSQLILNKPYKISKPDMISKETKELLEKMLIKDQKKRINAADVVKHPAFDKVRNHPDIVKAYKQPQTAEQMLADDFIYVRNGAFFLAGLAEELEFKFINETRFEVFFLLKKAVLIIYSLKLQLENRQQMGEYIRSNEQLWQLFLKNQEYNNCLKLIQNDFQTLLNKLYQYTQNMENFIQLNYQNKIQEMKVIVNPDINVPIPLNLFTEQMKEGNQLFSGKISLIQDIASDQARQLYLIMYMISVASVIDKVIINHKVDFEQFEQNKAKLSVDQIFECLEKIN